MIYRRVRMQIQYLIPGPARFPTDAGGPPTSRCASDFRARARAGFRRRQLTLIDLRIFTALAEQNTKKATDSPINPRVNNSIAATSYCLVRTTACPVPRVP